MTALYEENLDFGDTMEVHWSTGTILAVFFAAALISAVFFGLGYSLGGAGSSKSAVAGVPAATAAQPTVSSSSRALAVSQAAASASASQTSDSVRHVPVVLRSVSAVRAAHPAAMSAVRATPPVSARHATAVASGASKVHTMVQVGAIGNRKDAERLVAQLRKKGFYAGIYRGKHDKFLHVQIGPYKNEQQAQSMRHHLTASGYRAILKTAS